MFLLKMMSHMQSRLGPMDPGGFHGWFQLLADGVKFLQKEDIMPERGRPPRLRAGAGVVVISTFLVFVVIPPAPTSSSRNLDVGVFYALAVSSLSVIGVLMAGWASANKYSLLGGLRAAGQLIAYELPLVLAVVGVVIQAGTHEPAGHRRGPGRTASIFGFDGIGNPFILTQFVGFVLFLVAAQAELTQTPFDMPVAESELVAGYMVEYSGLPLPLLLHRRVRHRRSPSPPSPPRSSSAAGRSRSSTSTAAAMNVLGPIVLFAEDDARRRSSSSGSGSPTRASARTSSRRFAWKCLIPIASR